MSIPFDERTKEYTKADSGLGAKSQTSYTQAIIKNLQNMHAKSLPLTEAAARRRMELESQDWARGPACKTGDHTGRMWRSLGTDNDAPVD
jgi:hypothetical protein